MYNYNVPKGGEFMYDTFEAAKELGLQVRTIRHYIQSGKVKAEKKDGKRKWYIAESEIRRLKGENKD